jgi:aminoglycoside phosphotransferase (APT) family kinase protein
MNPSDPDIHYPVQRPQQEIDSYKTRYTDFDQSTIEPIICGFFGSSTQVKSISPSGKFGTSHVIYFVELGDEQRYVFRANCGVGPPEIAMMAEKLIADRLQKQDIPVNHVLFADISRTLYPFDYQIVEMMDGGDIELTFTGTKEEYDRLSYELGTLIARLGMVKTEGFGRWMLGGVNNGKLIGRKSTMSEYVSVYVPQDIAHLVGAEILTKEQGERIEAAFTKYAPYINEGTPSIVHYDLADHNLMTNGTNITAIFDWEASVSGDIILDLASAPTWKTMYPREELLLAGFRSVTALPRYFEEKYRIYLLRTLLWKMAYALKRGAMNEERKMKFFKALEPFGIS